jgi:Fe-Mn family superoxide dismutase
MSDQTVHTAFELPALPYGLQDLEPHLGEETLKVHHGRHHAKYVENLNRLLAGQDLAGVSLEGVLRRASESNQTALFNNAAQTWNHAFFWESMSARSSVPDGQLAQACLGRFGSLNNLRE